MKNKKSRNILIIIGGILILLAITNPSKESFEDYLKTGILQSIGKYEREGNMLYGTEHKIYWGRESNFLIFSFYGLHTAIDDKTYIGILGNFFRLDN